MFKAVQEQECENILEEGIYYISSSLDANKVVNIENGKYENFSNVNLWDKIDTEYQKYKITYDKSKKSYIITAVFSNKVLDVSEAAQKEHTNVQQYESNNTDAQRWILEKTKDGYYNIISKCNELYLDVDGAQKTNGTNIQMFEKNGTDAQKFSFIKAEENIGKKTLNDGIYNIVSKIDNNKAIEIEEQSIENNKKIQINRKLSVFNKNQKFEIQYLNNGYYIIKGYKSGKPLEVENGEHVNGTKIQQNNEELSNIQQWIIKESDEDGYFYLISRCNGLYLDVPYAVASDGTKLQMFEGNGTIAQKFRFLDEEDTIDSERTIEDGYYVISSKLNNNKVLDISGGSYNNKANLQIWDNANVQQQKYKVTYNSDENYYEIISANSGKNFDVSENGKTDGTNVIQYQKNNTIAQRWAIQKADNESYYIIALNSNLYLDISGGQTSNGTNVQIFEGNETNAQKFIFSRTNTILENSYKIAIKSDENKYLDISGGSVQENANLQIWTYDNVNQQVFSIEAINNEDFKIIARHSNKALTVTKDNNVVQETYNGSDSQQWRFDIVENGFFKIISKSTGMCLDIFCNGTANGTNVQVYQDNSTMAQMFKFKNLTIRNGIDVSSYNDTINWQIVRQFGNIDYAIIRAGYRGYRTGKIVTDSNFTENVLNARENRIDMGLYFYTQATNTYEAIEEANYVINLARQYNLQLKYPIYIDTEYSTADKSNPGRADNLDVYTRTAVCKAFCDTIRSNGYIPGVYASKYWFYNNLDVSQLEGYDIWVAHYTGSSDKPTDYRHKYDMWQYTSCGYVAGVNTVVDRNICYKNY